MSQEIDFLAVQQVFKRFVSQPALNLRASSLNLQVSSLELQRPTSQLNQDCGRCGAGQILLLSGWKHRSRTG